MHTQTIYSSKTPDISVIIPVYNTADYLPECLDSVVGQTFDSFEIIIVNDGSTDKSQTIIDDYVYQFSDRIRAFTIPNGWATRAITVSAKPAENISHSLIPTILSTAICSKKCTGTLTKGVFEVVGVHHNTMEEKKILEYAALAESFSSHPISRSLKTAYGKEIDQKRVTDVEEISGNGVTAKVDGISVAVGNTKLMKRIGVEAVECHQVGTVIHVAIDGAYAGHILISDVLKPTSKEAIVNLKKNGIKETVMLTGDIDKVAQQVAGELGVDRVYSELLPADKVSKVEELLAKKTEKEKLAFVGDGINDAPVLSRADIGIAMGALGSDAAIEAADVVLMDDDPMKIVKAIRIAKKCMRIVYENIYFAIGIKVICLLLGAVGIANMWVAIFADVGVMIIAVLNAIRTLFVKKL